MITEVAAVAGATLVAVVAMALHFARWHIEREREWAREAARDPRVDAIQEKRKLLERERDEWRLLGVGEVHKVVASIDARLVALIEEEARVRSESR